MSYGHRQSDSRRASGRRCQCVLVSGLPGFSTLFFGYSIRIPIGSARSPTSSMCRFLQDRSQVFRCSGAKRDCGTRSMPSEAARKYLEVAFWALGYSIFAVTILNIIPIGLVHPDLLVAVFCCLAGWAMLRFRRTPRMGRAVVLGLVLALGYYAKAPFFPIGFVFIACGCFEWPLSRRTILLGGTALVVFLLVSAPFIAALSRAKGRLTFGDSGRLNYAFFIDRVQHYGGWQGGPPGAGIPVHPTRKLKISLRFMSLLTGVWERTLPGLTLPTGTKASPCIPTGSSRERSSWRTCFSSFKSSWIQAQGWFVARLFWRCWQTIEPGGQRVSGTLAHVVASGSCVADVCAGRC